MCIWVGRELLMEHQIKVKLRTIYGNLSMAEMSHYTIHFIFAAENAVFVCVFLFRAVCCDQ